MDSIERRDDRVVVSFSWSDRSGARHEWAHALELTEGKIVSMHDFSKPSRASLLTRLRAAFT